MNNSSRMSRFEIWLLRPPPCQHRHDVAQVQIEKQNEIIRQQQDAIDELKQLVCVLKPNAAICGEKRK
jgi:hypothetical protein